MGLSTTEAAVLALWDAGLSKQAIYDRGLAPAAKVDQVVSLYHVGRTDDEDRYGPEAVAEGSRRLAAAIAAQRIDPPKPIP